MLSLLTILVLSSTLKCVDASDDIVDFEEEDELPDLPPDDTSHDCKTIKVVDHENFKKDPAIAHLTRIRKKFVKYNHAYGIPVFGVEKFTDEAMMRACYLVRYLFAGNEWLRRYSKKGRMYIAGKHGGWCCPPQVGNNGLSCPCDPTKPYPFLGKGAPAHEMAHWFIGRVLRRMAIAKVLKIPEFQDDEYHKYEPTRYLNKSPKDTFNDFLLNSYKQDKARKSTGIKPGKLHHYFIYTGQQSFIIHNNGLKGKNKNLENLKKNNKNLYALLSEIWQCENPYIQVCNDANYGFTKGLNQVMIMGKADPSNPKKMICRKDVDKPEIDKVDPIIMPTDDFKQEPGFENRGVKKCKKALRKGHFGKLEDLKTGDVEEKLGDGVADQGYEVAWWLRKCCAKTAKFSFIK